MYRVNETVKVTRELITNVVACRVHAHVRVEGLDRKRSNAAIDRVVRTSVAQKRKAGLLRRDADRRRANAASRSIT